MFWAFILGKNVRKLALVLCSYTWWFCPLFISTILCLSSPSAKLAHSPDLLLLLDWMTTKMCSYFSCSPSWCKWHYFNLFNTFCRTHTVNPSIWTNHRCNLWKVPLLSSSWTPQWFFLYVNLGFDFSHKVEYASNVTVYLFPIFFHLIDVMCDHERS